MSLKCWPIESKQQRSERPMYSTVLHFFPCAAEHISGNNMYKIIGAAAGATIPQKPWRNLPPSLPSPSPGMGVRGCHPRENFEIWDAIWCNLVHFGKKLMVLQFSTFVNENIAIMFDNGIDTVAYYFNFLVVWMPSEGELMVLLHRGNKFVSGGVLHPYGVAG